MIQFTRPCVTLYYCLIATVSLCCIVHELRIFHVLSVLMPPSRVTAYTARGIRLYWWNVVNVALFQGDLWWRLVNGSCFGGSHSMGYIDYRYFVMYWGKYWGKPIAILFSLPPPPPRLASFSYSSTSSPYLPLLPFLPPLKLPIPVLADAPFLRHLCRSSYWEFSVCTWRDTDPQLVVIGHILTLAKFCWRFTKCLCVAGSSGKRRCFWLERGPWPTRSTSKLANLPTYHCFVVTAVRKLLFRCLPYFF